MAHPELLLLGTLLAIVPVVIHRVARPRPRTLRISTMRFILCADGDRRRMARLRDILLLSTRTLAVAVMAAGFARPSGDGVLLPDGMDRVIVLDVSMSMGARTDGIPVLERAKALAIEALSGNDGSRFGLVLAGERPGAIFDELTSQAGALRREVVQARARPEALNAPEALATAVRLLHAASPGRRLEIVIVTDLQRTSWADVDPSTIPVGVYVTVQIAGGVRLPRNVAVIAIRPGPNAVGGGTVVVADIFNGSSIGWEGSVELLVDDQIWRQNVSVQAWKTASARFEVPHRPDGSESWVMGSALAVRADDDLPDDDRRTFAWPRERTRSVAVVTGQPRQRLRSSSDYLVRALSTGGESRRVVRTAPSELVLGAADPADALFIVRPGRFNGPAISALAAYVERGGCVVYVAEEPVDAGNLRRLGDRFGWSLARSVAWTAVPRPLENKLGEIDATRRPFRSFGTRARQAMLMADLRRQLTGFSPPGAAPDVLARFEDGSPALVLADAGRGRFAILAMELDGSPITRTALFVPLLEELIIALRGPEQGAVREVSTGSQAVLPVTVRSPEGLPLILAGPDGCRPGVRWSEDRVSQTAVWIAVVPGIYEVRAGRNLLAALSVECPAKEADLRPESASGFTERMAGGRRTVRARGGDSSIPAGSNVELWPVLALGALLLVCLEIGLLTVLRG